MMMKVMIIICDFNLSNEYDKLIYDSYDFNIQSIDKSSRSIILY